MNQILIGFIFYRKLRYHGASIIEFGYYHELLNRYLVRLFGAEGKVFQKGKMKNKNKILFIGTLFQSHQRRIYTPWKNLPTSWSTKIFDFYIFSAEGNKQEILQTPSQNSAGLNTPDVGSALWKQRSFPPQLEKFH